MNKYNPAKIDFTLMPVEFHDVVLVLQQAAESGKYEKNGWLEGKDFAEDKNNASKQRHLDNLRSGNYIDGDSGLDHDLHLACRALMSYTLRKRSSDKNEISDKTFNDFESELRRFVDVSPNLALRHPTYYKHIQEILHNLEEIRNNHVPK